MPRKVYKLDSILGGITPTEFGEQKRDTYDKALGIDPDFNTNLGTKTGGIITPVPYGKFSSSAVTGRPLWFLTNTKNSNVYAYNSDASFVRYNSSLASETGLTAPATASGNGAAYYNNYIYLATNTDISTYGPLDGSPAVANNFWTTTLGLNALSNTSYPSLPAGSVPNHAMHVHTDGFLYFCDVIASSYATTAVQGKGVIHRIGTKKGTSEGDTNNGSAYDVLELPFGYFPVDIESYGTDLAIVAVQTSSSTVVNQGRAALFLWDTFASIPYKQIQIPDPLATAVFNNNGALYVFSGNSSNGVRISRYNGADTMSQVAFIEDCQSPLAGAVDAFEDRLLFGGVSTYLGANYAVCYSFRSKNNDLPAVLHCPVLTSAGNSGPVVSAVKYVQQDSNIKPKAIAGWSDGISFGIDKYNGGGTLTSRFLWQVNVGRPFSVRSIRIPFDQAVNATTSITPVFYVDNLSGATTLTTVTNTLYSGDFVAAFKRPELAIIGQENFTLDLQWANTAALSVICPLEVEIDVFDVVKSG